MRHEHHPDYRQPFDSMQRAMGRGAQDYVLWQALRRIDGEPTPALDAMQIAMGPESQIRAMHDVIRAYLDEHNLQDTKGWAERLATGHGAETSSPIAT